MLVWLAVLADTLSRENLDPITRLTWVVAIILVQVFVIMLYWVVKDSSKTRRESSSPPAPESGLAKDYQDEKYRNQPTVCITCKTAIPAGATACPKCGWSYLSGS
jgi:ribosomal protein L40E